MRSAANCIVLIMIDLACMCEDVTTTGLAITVSGLLHIRRTRTLNPHALFIYLLIYVLATSTVILGRVPTFDSAHSW